MKTIGNRTTDTTITLENLEPGSTHSYIVQPISYTEISDNVSPEYITTATCGHEQDTRIFLATSEENTENRAIQTSNVISPLLILGIVIGILACIVIVILIIKKHRSN